MSRTVVAGTLVLVGYLTFADSQSVQPLRANTGLWQMTETITWTGLPPQMAAAMANGRMLHYTSCVTSKDLQSNPWANGSRQQCTWTVLNSTPNDMEVKGTNCMGMQGMTAEAQGKIHLTDAKDGTGSFDITMSGNGQTLMGHATYTGKWIGATCPAQ